MKHFDKIWRARPYDAAAAERLAREMDVSAIVAKILAVRGFNDPQEAERFLNPAIEKLYDPFLMKGMEEAVQRIRQAIAQGEKIWIYGDYDVDGITAISLLCRFFSWWGHPVAYYIPDRMDEGYGISERGINHLHESGCRLMISVDCGITSVDRVIQANGLGMDVIITDHHEPQDTLPPAVAVINPKQRECTYPEEILSGAGIALKLVQGLAPEALTDAVAVELLQIAALGTVADIVPLTGENRIIVTHGISAMRKSPIPGVQALIKAAGIDGSKVSTGHIGFQLAPRINAAGRIDAPQKGVQLLISEEETEVEALAHELSAINEERQRIERQIYDEAIINLEQLPNFMAMRVLVIAGEGWHPGVVGIVASRIVEKYYRPCILLCCEGDSAKGSARSIEGFNLFEALSSSGDLLDKYGGHAMAAGMTLRREKISQLREALNTYAEHTLTAYDLVPKLNSECALEGKDLQFSLLEDLEKLEPFGQGNAKPIFTYNNLVVDQRRLMGKNQEHIKLYAHDGSRTYEAVGFRWPEPQRYAPGQKIDLAFVLERNTFNGVDSLQMQLRDVRIRNWERYSEDAEFRGYWASLWKAIVSLIDIYETDNPSEKTVEITEVTTVQPMDKHSWHSGLKTRVFLWTPEAMEELLCQLNDIHPDVSLPVHYGTAPETDEIAVVINPDLGHFARHPVEKLFLWYPPLLSQLNARLDAYCKSAEILYNKSVGDGMVAILDRLVPTKEELAETYRSIRQAGDYQWLGSDYHRLASDPMTLLREEVRLWILEKNQLICRDNDSAASCYRIAPFKGERMNIADSRPYRAILDLKATLYRETKQNK